jgi:anti-sigma factor RsiW
MLNKNDHNSSCSRGEEVISYIYREMSTADARRFESHLQGCSECVAELAALSEPHLAVYEWRTGEFDHLSLPLINVQYERPVVDKVREHSVSQFFKSRSLVLKLGLGFAALVMVGFAILFGLGTQNPADVADSHQSPAKQIKGETSAPVVVQPDGPAVSKSTTASDSSSSEIAATSRRVASPSHSLPTHQRKASSPSFKTELASTSEPRSKPKQKQLRLNNFEEEDDNSLRLAELFEEVGSR